MLILNAAEVRQALPMPEAIAAMKRAFAALSAGRAIVPHRIHLSVPRNSGVSLIMPALLDDANPAAQALAVKVVSLFDGNQARGLARIQAAVLVVDPRSGRPLALLEGSTLTAIRTAAASGAATDLLARPESRVLAIFGAGVQARWHVEAMCAARSIQQARVYCRSPEKIAALVADLPESIRGMTTAAASPRQALAGADIVCAATTSSTPVFDDGDLPAGIHINAVGSYTPQAREIPAETVARARVVVDSRAAAWEEAGDLIQPLEAGLIDREHVQAELGELVLGQRPGRDAPRQITFFKSVGIAVQDAAAAQVALANARRMWLGTDVAF
jgi:ornithine cyclodeaminase/alanine dehydrogenase-like protein (mu-crystallin family)